MSSPTASIIPGGPLNEGIICQSPGWSSRIYYWDPVIAPGSSMAFYRGNLFLRLEEQRLFVGGLRGIGVYRLEMKRRQDRGGRADVD